MIIRGSPAKFLAEITVYNSTPLYNVNLNELKWRHHYLVLHIHCVKILPCARHDQETVDTY
jgi:hypothetical protein